jgi:hypothetical protein
MTDRLQKIKSQLISNESSLKDVASDFYILAIDETQPFTSGQRGALNYLSSQGTVDEAINIIDEILKSGLSSNHIQSTSLQNNLDNEVEPIVEKTHNGYKWYVYYENFPLNIDTTTYTNPKDAQTKADEFIEDLKRGYEPQWLKFGVSLWSHKNNSINICQADVLHLGKKYYILIARTGDGFSSLQEFIENNTVFFTNRVLNLEVTDVTHQGVENLINPTWVARGSITKEKTIIFYLLYELKDHTNYKNIQNALEKILCA